MALSGWNPPPYSQKMMGDLLYLQIKTLEDTTFQITASASGFFVNASTDSSFNPRPSQEPHHSATLAALLQKISPQFQTRYEQLQNLVLKRDPYEYLLAPHPVYPWTVRTPNHVKDHGRTLDAMLNSSETIDTFACRDWNEDIQSARELPKENVQDRVARDQALCKSHSDFVEACIRGVLGIAHKSVVPINPMDSEFNHMYIHNNIFFSQGYDNREQYDRYGGEEAAHVGVSKDVDGVKLLANLDLEGIYTLGTAVVDYKGIRTVCQTIVPGILKKASTGENSVKYGSVDSGNEISFDTEFHEIIQTASRVLHLAEHTAAASDGSDVKLFTSVDTKGVLGTDSRRYLLDLYRITPVDICFLESVRQELGENAYPHEMTLMRTELIEVYYEHQMREFIKAKQDEVGIKLFTYLPL